MWSTFLCVCVPSLLGAAWIEMGKQAGLRTLFCSGVLQCLGSSNCAWEYFSSPHPHPCLLQSFGVVVFFSNCDIWELSLDKWSTSGCMWDACLSICLKLYFLIKISSQCCLSIFVDFELKLLLDTLSTALLLLFGAKIIIALTFRNPFYFWSRIFYDF